MNKVGDIDAYIAGFPPEVRQLLELVRAAIREAAPDAKETISYAIPTFAQHGNLVHFAAFKNHIGFYGTPDGHAAFATELSIYKQGKGSVQFPLNQPLPLDLIQRIVRFKVQQNMEKHQAKKRKTP